MEIGGHVTKCGDAEGLGEGFERGVLWNSQKDSAGEADVVGQHLNVTIAADLLESEPYFESSKAAGVLGAEVKIVDGFHAEVIVGRMIGKCFAQLIGIAHERATCFE